MGNKTIQQALIHYHVAQSSCTWDLIINNTKDVIFCSPSCKKITGYPPETFLKNIRHIEKIIHPEDKHLCPVESLCENLAVQSQNSEYRIIVITGMVKWLFSIFKPIAFEDECHVGTLISSIDITPYRETVLQLEKQNDILHKRIEDLVKQLSGAYCDIENRENQLLIRNKQLEKTNKELLEANNALKVLAKNLDGIKKNTEEKLLNDIYSFIYPLLSKLKKADTKIAKSRLIDNLQFKIDELCQTLYNGNGISFRKSLTASEIKVAALIKDGLSSVEIAKDLKISVATVKTHRKNIRRKLKIQNFRINLANYLKLNWHNRIY